MLKAFCTALVGGSLFLLSGCGDGSVEIRTKNNNPPSTVVVEKEKPVIIEKNSPSKETTKTTVTTPDGTTRTKETTIKN